MKADVDLETVVITGMAYITNDQCGAVAQKLHLSCQGPRDASRILETKGFIKAQPKNWGRFDLLSQTTFASAMWACFDAGLSFGERKRRIGIIGTHQQGSLASNQAFFADYLAAGRLSARGHLFIYTLPTTPIAEVALFCGFTGPAWYLYQPSGGAGRLIEEAALCAAQDEIDAMLAVCSDSRGAVCFAVQRNKAKALFSTALLQEHLKGVMSPSQILEVLGVSQKDKDDSGEDKTRLP